MRVLLLANPDAAHTLQWVRNLTGRGLDVLLMGLQSPSAVTYDALPNVRVESAGVPVWSTKREGSAGKLLYLAGIVRARQLARSFRPDLVHAHYLTSYGLVGALAGVRPLVISVWGSDIFTNPDRSALHRKVATFTLARADRITATSQVMADRTRSFTNRPVDVVPFGIDLVRFAPRPVARPFAPGEVVIGTVKTLHEIYGIRYLIEAFAELRRRHPHLPLKLLIVGGGPQERDLKQLCDDLGVRQHTHFAGAVPSADAPSYHNMIDIFVALSNYESFGVSVLEAGACERPVVVSDAGGLPEIVVDRSTGFIVPRKDSLAAADAIGRLVLDPERRSLMGREARRRIAERYALDNAVYKMLDAYHAVTCPK